jgi:hypothetical protein
MDATSSSAMPVTTYQSIRRHTYEDLNLLNQNHIQDENKEQNKLWICLLPFPLKHYGFM